MKYEDKPSILVVGFTALDVVVSSHGVWRHAGGTAANVAANLAFFGWSSHLAATLGDDDAGQLARRDLAGAGVGVRPVELRQAEVTPLVIHEVRSNGHRFRFGCATCGRRYRRHRPLERRRVEPILADIGLCDVFFFDRCSPAALELAELHAAAGRLVVFEPSTGATVDLLRRAAMIARIVKYSADRAGAFEHLLPGSPAGQLRIVTLGEYGAKYSLGGRWETVPAFNVDAIDTGGAGDWMTAALIMNLVQYDEWTDGRVSETIRLSQAIAALSCMVPGARLLSVAASVSDVKIDAARLISGEPVGCFTWSEGSIKQAYELCPSCHLPALTLGSAQEPESVPLAHL